MVGSQALLVDGECALVERFGLREPALLPVEVCQPIEWMRHLGMIRSQALLADGECALVEWLGLREPALLAV